ncbi:DUF6119 family protein [Clavibacter nebraskensis]|uniref:DUF6119 family protein n=1 Tax=Clavibacter nebraskensis TaxID=31963 RepID=UPI003F845FB1
MTYGMGFQLLDQRKVDGGFGQRIAIRSADPKDLNSLTRVTLDERSRVERSSIPGGAHLRGFGTNDLGDLVTRLVASARIDGLSSGAKSIKIKGADSLSIPLSKAAVNLVSDLDALSALLNKSPANEELGLLEQLVKVKDKLFKATLDEYLLAAIRADDSPLLAISWPHERINEDVPQESYKILGGGRSDAQPGLPDLQALIAHVRSSEQDKQSALLDSMAVMLFRDEAGDEPASSRIPLRRWLAFQTDIDEVRYCLHDGSWYSMDKPYAERVRERTNQIFARGPGIDDLPTWPHNHDEADYNDLLAANLGGLCLDRDLMRSSFHKYGIEPCDVLLEDGTFIHVKNIDSSAPASHLLAQALVSAEVLTFDEEAKADFRSKIQAGGWDPDTIALPPKKLILVVARKGKAINSSSLFTFTQVSLARHVGQLGSQGVEVHIAPVEREE